MRQSGIFTKTRREAPADEVSKNAQLLIRAGFINKEIAGAYDMLPLGKRVIDKIQNIIREEMNAIGGQELSLTALQDPEVWKKTNRWDDETVDVWFKTKLKNDTELGLGLTHEEPLTNLMRDHLHSYKDLPAYVYQFQTKFRNELRAKSGLMRGREFLMKDLYSFSLNQESHDEFYEKSKQAYTNIFERCGLGEKTFLTVADGGSFGPASHEFQTITDAGEDIIYVDKEKNIAINEEVFTDEKIAELGLDKNNLKKEKAVEVGNIFPLGTKFSDALGLIVDDKDGNRVPVIMGSYGIGLGRLMGTAAEIFADEKGLVWPDNISPYLHHLVNLLPETDVADKIYEAMQETNTEVLYDDRDLRPGDKLKDMDLIGIPYQIVVGKRYKESGEIELVNRRTGESTPMKVEDFVASLKK